MARELRAARLTPSTARAGKRFEGWPDPPSQCDCCGGPAVLVQNRVLYGKNEGRWPLVWFCLCCEASVGCHPYSRFPLGRMADRQVKAARHYVHTLLDPLWQGGLMERSEAYRLLAEGMGIPVERCHVSWMDMVQCTLAAEVLRGMTLVEDFGA